MYELGALLIMIPLTSLVLGIGMLHFGVLALILSGCAVSCNMLYQHAFERLEVRFGLRRTIVVRMLHAVGFETFFTAVALPLTVWWLAMGWLEAFLLDLTLTLFFLLYTFFYNWIYDSVRGRQKRA